MALNTFEFEITIQSKSGENSWPLVVRCKQPDGLTTHAQETLQLTQEDFNQLLQQQENEKKYGILLGQALFKGSVRETFVRTLSKNADDCLLRVLLSIEASDRDRIKTLHWERLCAPIDADGSWQILVQDQRVPFSIYIPTIVDRRFPPIGRRDLRCLVVVASPSNLGKYQLTPFDVEGVLSGIKEALGEIPYDVLANDIEGALGPPSLQELSKQLTHAKKPYTLLHFVCHGKLLDSGETVLYLANPDDSVQPVPGEDLLAELKNIGNHQRSLPHFAFLCSCETADPRAEGALGGLGQRLVRTLGMPAVVAMTRKVSVATALVLGQNFYRRLRESGEADLALQEATAGLGKRHDLTVPALFSRLGGRPLFSDRLDDRELTDEEIDYGIEKLRVLLQERAPNASVLKRRFEKQVKILKNTRGAESRSGKAERSQALLEIDNLCEQVLEIGFEAIAALGKAPPEYKAECPFPGLSSFGEKRYHKFFFGRDELIKSLQKELEKDNFLAVIGTSGSGKSSVVLAGLIPQLKEEEPDLRWAYLTPTGNPIAQLDKRLEILSKSQNRPTLLVVDQFEELFTLCDNKETRQEFIQKLFKFAERQKVAITMRADFLGECTYYPDLRKRIETRQKLVGPMEPSELVTAMKMQADSAGLRFEAGLSNAIFNEVRGEPGAMPLLQYALQELWKRRHGRWLCDEEYQAIGGVQQAIAKTANDFYHNLPEFEQQQLQNIFLRLTRLDDSGGVGDNRRDTRRRVEVEELVTTGADPGAIKKLVQQLAGEGARLVVTSRNETTGKEEVEVAHEALIRHWPLLQEWLDRNRNDLQLRESINRAARDWDKHKEQPDAEVYLIHQGGRLEDAETLLKQPKSVSLNPEEAEYVNACIELRDRLRKQERQRRRRQLFAATSAAFVCGAFAIFAGYQWRKAEIKQIEAFLEATEARLVTHRSLDARITSIQAEKLLDKSFWQKVWPDRKLGPKVTDKLYQSVYAGPEVNRLRSDRGTIYGLELSRDGHLVATASDDNIVRLWDTSSGKLLQEIKSEEKVWLRSGTLSPDGKLLATGGDNGIAHIWDTASGKQLKKLQAVSNKGLVVSMVFSPDGKLLATGGSDGTARIWDTASGKKIATLQDEKKVATEEDERPWVVTVAFSPDGKLLAIGGNNGSASIWDTSGKKVATLSGHEGWVNIKFSPKGDLLATTGLDEIARIWNTSGTKLYTLKVNNASETSMSFSPDGSLLATSGPDDTVSIWNTANGEQKATLEGLKGGVRTLAFSPDGKLLATGGSDGTARLWDTSGNQWGNFEGHQGGVNSVAFSPDGRSLFTSGYERSARIWDISNRHLGTLKMPDGTMIDRVTFSPDRRLLATKDGMNSFQIWDISGTQLTKLKGHEGKIYSVAFSPDGKLLATGGEDGTASIWDTSGTVVATLEGHQGSVQIAFSPDGQLLATTGADDGTVRLWDTSGKNVVTLEGHQGSVQEIAFSPDGQLLATTGADDGTVRLWDTSGKNVATLEGHQGSVQEIAFSPDGQLLATTGADDGTVRLWDTSGKNVATLEGHQGLVQEIAFSPDGQLLATTSIDDDTVRLWDTSGKNVATLEGHEDGVISIAFSPDGKLLATGGTDDTVRLWDTSGKNVTTLEGYENWVTSIAFSPDGKLLAMGRYDGTVSVGPIGDLDELQSFNCNWLGKYLNNPSANLDKSDRQVCGKLDIPHNPATEP